MWLSSEVSLFMLMKRKSHLVGVLWFTGAMLFRSAPAATQSPTESPKPVIKAADLFPDEVVAKGKDLEIKRSEVDDAMGSIKSSAAAQGQAIPAERLSALQQQVLDRLIQIHLLLTKATEPDKVAGKETTDERLEDIKTRAGSDETLNRQLKAVGTTKEELRSKMIDESTAQAVLEREMNIKISDADVQKFYNDNPSKFEQPEMVRASHILLSTRDLETGRDLTEDKKVAKHKEAEALLKRARDGEDFAKLAKENSQDPGSKDRGGEYQFPRGQMDPSFEAAAFSLKTNEVSDIVTTQFGFHIIKLSEKIPAKKVDLAKVAQKVKDYLAQQEMQKHQQEVQDYITKLKKDADVQILDESLKLKEPESTSGLPAGQPPVQPAKKSEPK
jgi:peptidyl-prolyl cis-trans isomerase C